MTNTKKFSFKKFMLAFVGVIVAFCSIISLLPQNAIRSAYGADTTDYTFTGADFNLPFTSGCASWTVREYPYPYSSFTSEYTTVFGAIPTWYNFSVDISYTPTNVSTAINLKQTRSVSISDTYPIDLPVLDNVTFDNITGDTDFFYQFSYAPYVVTDPFCNHYLYDGSVGDPLKGTSYIFVDYNNSVDAEHFFDTGVYKFNLTTAYGKLLDRRDTNTLWHNVSTFNDNSHYFDFYSANGSTLSVDTYKLYLTNFHNLTSSSCSTHFGMRFTYYDFAGNSIAVNVVLMNTVDNSDLVDERTYYFTGGSTDASSYTDGYNNGYNAGQNVGYTNGYSAGQQYGYTTGYNAGDTAGQQTGYTAGYNAGLSSSQTESYNQGYSSGYDAGNTAGYDAGNTAGYNNGYAAGATDGYEQGYAEGLVVDNPYTFNALFGAVLDAPVQTFTGLFNFELLGVNLLGLFTGLLTLAAIIWVIKLALGGK